MSDGTREKMDAGSMERMKFIGITGGVGAGKSEILHYLETKDGVKSCWRMKSRMS